MLNTFAFQAQFEIEPGIIRNPSGGVIKPLHLDDGPGYDVSRLYQQFIWLDTRKRE